MNPRDFREALVQAFVAGLEFSMAKAPTEAEIRGATIVGGDGPMNLLMTAANRYAGQQILSGKYKLEAMQ